MFKVSKYWWIGDPLVYIFKKSHNAEKLKGPFSIFQHPFRRNSPPGIVYYSEKKEKPFWFCSLGQQEQYKILYNFWKTYFDHFRCTLKKHYSRLFSWEKRRLKNDRTFLNIYLMKYRSKQYKRLKASIMINITLRKPHKTAGNFCIQIRKKKSKVDSKTCSMTIVW